MFITNDLPFCISIAVLASKGSLFDSLSTWYRYIRRIVFEGGHIVDPDQVDFFFF